MYACKILSIATGMFLSLCAVAVSKLHAFDAVGTVSIASTFANGDGCADLM